MRLRALLLALPLSVSLLFAAPSSSADTTWRKFSTAPVVNFADAALHRTPDGVLHVLWVQDDGSNKEDLFQTTISADGAVAPAGAVLTDWDSMWSGGGDIAPMSDGRMRYFFGGIRGSGGNDNLNMLTSDAAGTSWTLTSGNIVDGGDGPAYASTVGATSALDGTPFQTFGGSVHRGTSASSDVVSLHDELDSNCCAYESDVATDQSSGRMFFAWYSNGTNASGVWVHEIDPDNADPVGDPMLVPGVGEPYPDEGDPQSFSAADTRIPITGRPGHDGVYVAYTGGYPFTQRVLVWRVGEAESVRVANTNELQSHNDPAIAADSNGRLWVGWTKGERLFVRRSNPDVTRWGRAVSFKPAAATRSIFDLKLNAQTGLVDVVALFDTDTDNPALWHRQVYPGLTFTASPTSFRRQANVRFTVLDAGEPVSGVRVSAGGENGTTNAAGEVTLNIGPYGSGRRLTATASKDGYTQAKLRLRVRG